MTNHQHKECEHKNLKHCNHCDIVYCEDCKKEWGKETFIDRSYPSPSYPGTYPTWTTTTDNPGQLTCCSDNQITQ